LDKALKTPFPGEEKTRKYRRVCVGYIPAYKLGNIIYPQINREYSLKALH